MKGHVPAFILYTIFVGLTSQILYPYQPLVYLGDDDYLNFPSDIFPAFTQAIANMQCPFHNKTAFYH